MNTTGVDAQGQMLYRVGRTGPGTDGVYFTADDATQTTGLETHFTIGREVYRALPEQP